MGLLDALLDEQFRRDVGRGLLDAGNRGAVAGLLGGPVDLAALAMRPFGYSAERPVGGSEWIGQKMQDAGLVTQNRNPVAEMLAGIAGPALAYRTINGLLNLPASGKIGVSFESKSPRMSDPKPTPQRPFYDDYPQGATGPEGSKLAFDIDGHPLVAQYIAGRRVGGGMDESIQRIDAHRIASDLGIKTDSASRSGTVLRGDAGRYVRNGDQRAIIIDEALSSTDAQHVLQHELGHSIDDLAQSVVNSGGSKIPTAGIKRELAQVYSDLNSTMYVPRGKIGATPESHGYAPNQVDAERMAEAIRAYLQDPNYIKTVAPQTAARIREYVNQNPNINKVVQFNAAASLLADGDAVNGILGQR